jgi:hypothetical protein
VREFAAGVGLVLACLMCVLSPQGTGQGVHRDQLVDWLFPHLHLDQAAHAQPARRPNGIALGAGGGADVGGFGLGAIAVPAALPLLDLRSAAYVTPREAPPPRGRSDPPLDPPPTS